MDNNWFWNDDFANNLKCKILKEQYKQCYKKDTKISSDSLTCYKLFEKYIDDCIPSPQNNITHNNKF